MLILVIIVYLMIVPLIDDFPIKKPPFLEGFGWISSCSDLDCQSAVNVPSEWDWPGYLERPTGHRRVFGQTGHASIPIDWVTSRLFYDNIQLNVKSQVFDSVVFLVKISIV